MSLCPYAYLRVSLSGLLTAPDQGSLPTSGELFNISALDPLLPTLLIATLCLCVLLTILYYSLAVAWEVFWASRRSPSPLDSSAEVVLTGGRLWTGRGPGTDGRVEEFDEDMSFPLRNLANGRGHNYNYDLSD